MSLKNDYPYKVSIAILNDIFAYSILKLIEF